jgi:hypothetical protein
MRDMKFRAWYEDGKRMIYGLPNFQNGHFYDDRGLGIDFRVLKLMHYIGLQDKNGKPIYEGDMLEGRLEHGVVVWIQEEARWGIDVEGNRRDIQFRDVNHDQLDVIGNIYENPDLLT